MGSRAGGARGFGRAMVLLLGLGVVAACVPGLESYPQRPAPGDVEFSARTALYEVFVRHFSPRGDLRGVLEGLDRIEAVGAEVVWLMPIHPIGEVERKGEYGSPYSVRDYTAINPDFGTEPTCGRWWTPSMTGGCG
jgi:glycosidase